MKNLKYILVLSLLFFLMAMPVKAAIRLSTEKFEFIAKPSDNYITGSFTVQNDGNESVRFKAYPEYFEISEEGTIQTELKDKNNNSLSKNIRFNPAEFTLNQKESQIIRFTLTNIQSLPNGESRAALFLEDAKTKLQALPTGNSKVAANLVVKTRIAIPIYLDKGQIVKVGSIDQLSLEKFKNKYLYDLKVKASGNSLIRVGGTGQIVKDNSLITEFPINERPIQAGTTGKIKDFIPVENLSKDQQYTLKITLIYKSQDNKDIILKEEIPFKLNEISKEG